MERRTYLFSGNVQGVGFRQTAVDVAARHDVAGYVRNLDDGRVEMVIEGPSVEVDQVVQTLHERMDYFIRDVKSHTSAPTGEYEDFSITR